MASKKETPMAKQWREMKATLPEDVLLFFRLGDFYELFDEDATRAAHLLEITLTKRSNRCMCGVPYHAAREYIAKAVKAGFRVALAEQTGEVKPGKLVAREISQIISAGTVLDSQMLDPGKSNWLAAVQTQAKEGFALALADHSTGEFQLLELANQTALEDALARFQPAEIIYPEPQRSHFSKLEQSRLSDPHAFDTKAASRLLTQHFQVQSLDGFGLQQKPALVGVAGALLHYLHFVLQQNAAHLKPPLLQNQSDFVQIDASTQASLDLIESPSGRAHSLLGAIDLTLTSGGSRLLRFWLSHPSKNAAEITSRQQVVAKLFESPAQRTRLREQLQLCRDVERSVARLSQGSGNARDLLSLAESLAILPEVAKELATFATLPRAQELQQQLPFLTPLKELLQRALQTELPLSLKDGGLIANGFNEQLDELRSAQTQGKEWLAQMQQREAESTSIKTLKVGYNSVFGYFLEVSKSQLDKVPNSWVRKQTTANNERYITEELKRLEEKILGAEERAKALEYELFCELRTRTLEERTNLQGIAAALSQIDVLTSFAEVASLRHWCRPKLTEKLGILLIESGRHPVLDSLEIDFVANHSNLEPKQRKLLFVTGPNMAGKSTYIRQNALLVLLAQCGSYVPAESMSWSLVDRIFARVGASDNLAKGQSTFMVEMTETAAILHHASPQSLVILDEIGRGTATWDGLSLAWSIAEFLHNEIGCRTLFATHYHELTELTKQCPAMANIQVSVQEHEGKIIFLHRIIEGCADKSYGIQVAKLAGLPEAVLQRASTILETLESQSEQLSLQKKSGSTGTGKKRTPRDILAQHPDLFATE